MKLELLNIFGQSFKGGDIKIFPKDKTVFFSSGKFLIFFGILSKKMKTFDFGIKYPIISFDIQKKGQLLIIFYENKQVILFDLKIKKVKGKLSFKNQCLKVKWAPIGTFFATLIANVIQIWKLSSSKTKKFSSFFLCDILSANWGEIIDFNWDQKGKHVIVGSSDFLIRIFYLGNKSKTKICDILKSNDEISLIELCAIQNEVWCLTRKNILRRFSFFSKDFKNKNNNPLKNRFFDNFGSYLLKMENALLTKSIISTSTETVVQGYANGILVIFKIQQKNHIHFRKIGSGFHSPSLIYPVKKLDFFKSQISSIFLCEESNIMLVGSYKQQKIFILNKLKPITILTPPKKNGHFTSLDISYNDRLFCTGNSTGILQIWSIKSGNSILFFRNHVKEITNILFLKKTSRFVLSCSIDGIVHLFDLKKLAIIRTMESIQSSNNLKHFDINFSNKLLVSSCKLSSSIFIWSIKTGNIKENLENTNFKVSKLKFLEKKNEIISIDNCGLIKIWTLNFTPTLPMKVSLKVIDINIDILGFSLNPNFNELAFLSTAGELLILHSTTFDLLNKFLCSDLTFFEKHPTKTEFFLKSTLQYSSDGKFIFLLNDKKTIFFTRTKSKNIGAVTLSKINNSFDKPSVHLKSIVLRDSDFTRKLFNSKDIVDIKNFHCVKNWIILYRGMILTVKISKDKSDIKNYNPINILRERGCFLLRIIQIALFEENFFFLRFLFLYFPYEINYVLSSLILMSSIVKQLKNILRKR